MINKLLSCLFLLAFAIVLLPICSSSQGIYTIDRRTLNLSGDQDLNRILFNPQLPELEVEVKEGYKFDLRQFIRSNAKHKNMPVLIITTYDFCSGCIEFIKMIQAAGIAGKYNVVAIYERTGSDKSNGGAALENLLMKKDLGKTCTDVLFVTVDADKSGRAFLERATPLFLFCDKDLKPVHGFISLRIGGDNFKELVELPLDLIASGQMSRKELWYNSEMEIQRKGDKNAILKRTLLEQDGRVMLSLAFKDTVVYRRNYLLKDSILVYDGSHVENYLTGDTAKGFSLKKYYKMNFSNGRATSDFTTYNRDGSTNIVIPYNGIMKNYDDSGHLATEGMMVNGLGEGIFTYYNNKKIAWKITFLHGEVSGPYLRYEDGILKTKGNYLKGKGGGLLVVYDSTGNFSYETYQSDKYDETGHFKDGLARVSKDGEYGYIDKNGTEVIQIQFSEASDFENGKAKVTRNNRNYIINVKGQ